MIELLDVGDRVAAGRYRLHCRFREALVFALERPVRPCFAGTAAGDTIDRRPARKHGRAFPLAFAVDESKGRGPVNILVRGLRLVRGEALEVRPGEVILGDRAFTIASRYDSSLPELAADPVSFGRNLRAFERTLIESASEKSLAVVIDEKRKRHFTSGFEKEFLRSVSSGVERFLSGELEDGAAAIRGLGFGLTPSGDDFLAGFMLGLHALQRAFGADLTAEINAISRVAHSDNAIAQQFLLCAAQGRFFERAKALVQSLCEGDETAVTHDARELLAVGASSGADLATGLLLALTSYRPRHASARLEQASLK